MPKRFFFNGSHPSCPFNSRPLLTKPPRKSNPANKTSRMRGWDDEHEMRSWMCLAPSSWFYINHYSSMVHILGGGNPPILTLEYCCQLWPLWLFWNHLPSGTAWRVFASWFPDSTFKKAKGLVSSKLDQPESYISEFLGWCHRTLSSQHEVLGCRKRKWQTWGELYSKCLHSAEKKY